MARLLIINQLLHSLNRLSNPNQSQLGGLILRRSIRNASSVRHRAWKEKQQAEIRKRDEEAQGKRDETIARAEKAIDDFYTEYNAKKEKQIAKNKCVEASNTLLACFDEPLCAQGGGIQVPRIA
jgi:hypothetical protein